MVAVLEIALVPTTVATIASVCGAPAWLKELQNYGK